MHFFRHAGPEDPAPYLIRGHPDVVPTKVGNHLTDWVPVFTGNPGFRLSPERRLSLNQAIYGETLFNIGLNLWVSTYRELIRGGLYGISQNVLGYPLGARICRRFSRGICGSFTALGQSSQHGDLRGLIERDIAGALGPHRAALVQYIRPAFLDLSLVR